MEYSDKIYHLKHLLGRETTHHLTMTLPAWPCSRACVPCQAWLALGHGAPGLHKFVIDILRIVPG